MVDVARGRAEFEQRGCNACHPGGGKGLGPPLAGVNEKTFSTVVRQGRGMMPAFGPDRLGDEALADIFAYLQSLGSTSN